MRNPIQRRHQLRRQRQRDPQVAAAYRDQPPAAFQAFVPLRAAPKRQMEILAIIELPLIDARHIWMMAQRDLAPGGSAIAKSLDYSLKRWMALTRYPENGAVPIDNNAVENQIRPWALGRSKWLFAWSLRSGKRAAAVMSLIQSARVNGHDLHAYLKDVLTRLPTQRASEITEWLPHRWAPIQSHKAFWQDI